jgi:hypothetical protein
VTGPGTPAKLELSSSWTNACLSPAARFRSTQCDHGNLYKTLLTQSIGLLSCRCRSNTLQEQITSHINDMADTGEPHGSASVPVVSTGFSGSVAEMLPFWNTITPSFNDINLYCPSTEQLAGQNFSRLPSWDWSSTSSTAIHTPSTSEVVNLPTATVSDVCAQKQMDCTRSSIETLQTLRRPSMDGVCLMSNDPVQQSECLQAWTMDAALRTVQSAARSVEHVLNCHCSSTVTVQLLTLVACRKMTTSTQALVRVLQDDGSNVSTWDGLIASERIVKQPVCIGKFPLDYDIARHCETQMVLRVLRRIMAIVNRSRSQIVSVTRAASLGGIHSDLVDCLSRQIHDVAAAASICIDKLSTS